jgi:glycosyltransferase involved in cell wall biosynthesis
VPGVRSRQSDDTSDTLPTTRLGKPTGDASMRQDFASPSSIDQAEAIAEAPIQSALHLPTSVAVVTFDTARTGGMETLSLDVVAQLRAAGIRCSIVAPRRLGNWWGGRQLGRGRFMLELVHALRDVEAILSMHQLFLMPIQIALRVGRPRSRPRLHCWLHGIEVWGSALESARAQLERCESLIASSAFTAARVLEREGRWPSCHVVHPLGDAVNGSLPPTPPPAHLSLLTVARINRDWAYKGHQIVLNALRLLRAGGTLPHNLRWRVAGSGDDLERLSQEVRAAGLSETVQLLGRVDQDSLEREYRNCSVFVMPSAYSVSPSGKATGEGFGIVYLEAANAGRASIGCTEGGQTDLITHGVNGWLVRPDPQELAAQLLTLLENPALVRDVGAAAYRVARERFSTQAFTHSLHRALSMCHSGSTGPGER